MSYIRLNEARFEARMVSVRANLLLKSNYTKKTQSLWRKQILVLAIPLTLYCQKLYKTILFEFIYHGHAFVSLLPGPILIKHLVKNMQIKLLTIKNIKNSLWFSSEIGFLSVLIKILEAWCAARLVEQ